MTPTKPKPAQTKPAAKPEPKPEQKAEVKAEAEQRKEPEPKKALPVVDGKQVVAILKDGRETKTQFHVQMEDGTTRHVDKELFN